MRGEGLVGLVGHRKRFLTLLSYVMLDKGVAFHLVSETGIRFVKMFYSFR